MKKEHIVLFGLIFSIGSAFSAALELSQSSSSLEFLAIGRPSAIKIKGKVKDDIKSPIGGRLNLTSSSILGKASFELNNLDTGIELRNQHMKEKYLQTDKFPKAEIEIKKLELSKLGSNETLSWSDVPFEGVLTLHGIQNPIQGVVQAVKNKNRMELTFNFNVPISKFGIETPSFLGIKVVDDVAATVRVTSEIQ